MNENQASNDVQAPGVVNQPPVSQTPPEKLLSQTEVNNLVGAVKQKAYERGRQETMQELQQQQQQAGSQQAQNAQVPPLASNSDEVRRIAADEFMKQQQAFAQAQLDHQRQAHGQRIFGELQSKFSAAKATNPSVDFEKTIDEFKDMPDILELANSVDNPADVIQSLRDNPGKIANMRVLPPNFARVAMKQLSDSIKQNQQAEAAPKSPEPLSQIRPSSVGVGNSDGSSSISDKYKGRY